MRTHPDTGICCCLHCFEQLIISVVERESERGIQDSTLDMHSDVHLHHIAMLEHCEAINTAELNEEANVNAYRYCPQDLASNAQHSDLD